MIDSINGLQEWMFSSKPNQILFKEMVELKEKNLVPDPTLVVQSMKSKNILDDIGGERQIEFLLSKNVAVESFTEFVSIVVTSYKARSYISLTSGVEKDKINASNIDEMIMSTRKSLDSLLEARNLENVFHVGDLVKDAYQTILERKNNPGIRGTTWGIPILDKATGGKCSGDLWVIGGRPGMGKTALVCNSVLQDGLAGVPSLLIEREMRNQELLERLVSIDTGIPNTDIRLGVLDNRQTKQIYDSFQKISKLPIYLDTNFMCNDPSYIEGTINKFRTKHGIEIVYLDYIQIATDRDEQQTQAIGRLSRLAKLMSNNLGICFVLLSQLNRNLESREDKRPLMSDFKMSGALEEDPDFAVGLYRDEHYNKETKHKNKMEFIVLKHRNGPSGTVPLSFDGPSYRIGEA